MRDAQATILQGLASAREHGGHRAAPLRRRHRSVSTCYDRVRTSGDADVAFEAVPRRSVRGPMDRARGHPPRRALSTGARTCPRPRSSPPQQHSPSPSPSSSPAAPEAGRMPRPTAPPRTRSCASASSAPATPTGRPTRRPPPKRASRWSSSTSASTRSRTPRCRPTSWTSTSSSTSSTSRPTTCASDDDLQPIGATAIYPLGLYSTQYDSVDDIPEGSTVAVPNDESNQARGLLVLQSAGLDRARGRRLDLLHRRRRAAVSRRSRSRRSTPRSPRPRSPMSRPRSSTTTSSRTPA